MKNTSFEQNTKLFPNTPVKSVSLEDGVYVLKTQDGQTFTSTTQPLLAGGFSGSHKFVSHLFDEREDGFPEPNESDESTVVPEACFSVFSRSVMMVIFFVSFSNSVSDLLSWHRRSPLHWIFQLMSLLRPTKAGVMYLDDLSCCGQECLTC